MMHAIIKLYSIQGDIMCFIQCDIIVFQSVHSWMVQVRVRISLSEGQTFEIALVISHNCLGCWFLALNLPISFHCIRLPAVKRNVMLYYLSHHIGKPTICIGQNKDADQLRGNQRLCFRYSDSTIPLLLKSEISSF